MAQILCAPHLKLVAIRATRLNADCTFATGANNMVTTAAAIRFNVETDIEEGEEIIQRNGDGVICLNLKDPDELKRLDAELEMCTRDMELVEILTGEPLVLDGGGDTIGGSRSVGAIDHDGAFVEIWVRAGSSTGACVTGAAQYARYVYPTVKMILGSNTFENGLNNMTLTGTVEANPNALDGPFSDWPGAGNIPANAAEIWAYDAGGPPAASCGYGVDVPADANTP